MAARKATVLIVDDEPPARQLLVRYISNHPELTLVGEAGDGQSALALIEQLQPSLVLLDVEMPQLDGFAVLDELRRKDLDSLRFIFVTAFDHYAVRAFEINAVDYLLKPVTRQRFDTAIERYFSNAPDRGSSVHGLLEDALRLPPQRLLVRERGRIVPVVIRTIDWIEAEGDYSRIHFGGKALLIEKGLNDLERLLMPRGFLRIHRGAIVNLDRIEELHAEGSGRYRLKLRDGTELIVSRSHAHLFRSTVL